MSRSKSNDTLIRICQVIEGQTDTSGACRVKVRLPGFDIGLSDDELPWCFPLLPKLVHVYPKPGEAVLVILEQQNGPMDNRFYIGPIISQPYYHDFEPYATSSLNALVDAKMEMLPDPENNPNSAGTLPNMDDIALIGRKNSDVVLKDNEVRIRCGQQKNPDWLSPIEKRLDYNTEDPAYIQLKYQPKQNDPNTKNSTKDFSSVANIYADRINIMSRDGKTPMVEYTNPDNLMSEEQLTDKYNGFLAQGHKAVYGDLLVDFLKDLRNVLLTHTHPFPGVPPALSQASLSSINIDLDTLLVDYLRMS